MRYLARPEGATEGATKIGYSNAMLTDTAVKRLQPRPSPYRAFDGGDVAGFGVQVTQAGAKSWFLRYQWRGKRRYLTLGHYPHTGTAAARQKAREALAKLDQGIDPGAPARADYGTLEALLAAWLAHRDDAGRRRSEEVERMIRGNCANLLNMPANSVTASDIRAALSAVHRRGARVLANRLRAHLHTMFRYGLQHDHDPRTINRAVLFGLAVNPVDAIPRDAGAERTGERVLTWAEVRDAWHSETLSWPARQAVRLLLVFGCRVNEICGSPWVEFDFDAGLWTLPPQRSKNGREHQLPIPQLAIGLLAELRDVIGGYWLFPWRNVASAQRPWGASALSHGVRAAKMDWIPRDLRRTWKTRTGEIGIEKGIRDRIQNHALQDVGSRHYDRYMYVEEKRQALDRWCHELATRVSGDNVIPLITKRAIK